MHAPAAGERNQTSKRDSVAVVIHLGCRLPGTSSDQPEGRAGHSMPLLFGLAPGGVCQAGQSPDRWCALTAPFHRCSDRRHRQSGPPHRCGTFLGVAPTGYYPAPCPLESRLSSPDSRSGATTRSRFAHYSYCASDYTGRSRPGQPPVIPPHPHLPTTAGSSLISRATTASASASATPTRKANRRETPAGKLVGPAGFEPATNGL